MELSSKVRYSLLALLELARHYEQRNLLQVEQIAAIHQIPERYLGQLLMALRRSGLVRSQRGAKGGYVLAKHPWQITVSEVLACLEGSNLNPNAQTASVTAENAAIEEVWQEATTAALTVFQRRTLQDLCDKRDENQQSNITYYI